MYRMNRKEKFQLRVESFLPLEYPRGFVDGPMDTVDEFSLFWVSLFHKDIVTFNANVLKDDHR